MSYDVLISNSNLNTRGFRVLTSGIDITQHQRNPIMLFMHNRPWRGDTDAMLPLGTVENMRFEGDNLMGTLKFDEADDFSRAIKAKWDAGTLRMVSPGLEPIERSEDPAFLLPGQKYSTVTKSKLVEVSVVDMGGNDDALALYDDGKLITLTMGGDNDFLQPININQNEGSMKSIALFLGLPEGASEADILAKVTEIKLAADKVTQLELAAETQRELAITTEVENAITLKRVTADKKDHFIALGKKVGVEDLRATLQLMSPAKKPNEVIYLGKDGKEVDEYKKLSDVPEAELKLMRENDKEAYQKLFKAEYGTEISL
jgi:hypothetical protein